jgi:hypothetical protein
MYAANIVLKNDKKLNILLFSLPEGDKVRILDENTGNIKTIRVSDIKEGVIFEDHYRDEPSMEFFTKCRLEGWL